MSVWGERRRSGLTVVAANVNDYRDAQFAPSVVSLRKNGRPGASGWVGGVSDRLNYSEVPGLPQHYHWLRVSIPVKQKLSIVHVTELHAQA